MDHREFMVHCRIRLYLCLITCDICVFLTLYMSARKIMHVNAQDMMHYFLIAPLHYFNLSPFIPEFILLYSFSFQLTQLYSDHLPKCLRGRMPVRRDKNDE